jgi:hypothetical protein
MLLYACTAHLEGPGMGGRIILKCISEKWGGGMGWIGLVEVRHRFL